MKLLKLIKNIKCMREHDDEDYDLGWDLGEDSEDSEIFFKETEMSYNVASVQLSEIPLKYIEKYLRTKKLENLKK